jgi:hypothetical protein
LPLLPLLPLPGWLPLLFAGRCRQLPLAAAGRRQLLW